MINRVGIRGKDEVGGWVKGGGGNKMGQPILHMSRLSMITWVSKVPNGTVVDSD